MLRSYPPLVGDATEDPPRPDKRYFGVLPSSPVEIQLARAEHHIAEGERLIARQKELIDRLGGRHRDTLEAEALLHEFERSLALHIAERDRLRRKRDT